MVQINGQMPEELAVGNHKEIQWTQADSSPSPQRSTTPPAGAASACRATSWPTSACIRRSLGEGGRESPELYRRKTNGEIAEAESPASGIASLCRDKLALGRAAHCLILEGKAAFDGQFIVADALGEKPLAALTRGE